MHCRLIISERNDPNRQSFGRIWDWLRNKLYRHADIVTANSQGALKTLSEYVPQKKCRLVPNPIFSSQSSESVTFDKPTVLAVGRLNYQKAYDILLEAFSVFSRQYLDWQLVILGDGPLRESLQAQAKKLALTERIQWMGYLKDPYPYYRAADIFVMPSRYEGMPNALLEAMNCGLPAIVSDASPGPLEVIKHNKNGIVVPVEDSTALAKAVSLLAENAKLRENFSQKSRESVEPFHIDRVIPQWDFVFEN